MRQAYTEELEKEVDRLLNENQMLKRQHEQVNSSFIPFC